MAEPNSNRDCPDCGVPGHDSRAPDLLYCPDCDITYDKNGNTNVPQFD